MLITLVGFIYWWLKTWMKEWPIHGKDQYHWRHSYASYVRKKTPKSP